MSESTDEPDEGPDEGPADGAANAVRVRKRLLVVETIRHEGGGDVAVPVRRAAALAVIANPFAGRHVPGIRGFMEALKPLGLDMAAELVGALGGAGRVQSYGKGAIVGADGESEHGATWHVPGGYAMRELLGAGGVPSKAIVPSAMKVGGVGARLDVPIGHVDAAYVRSHFDAMELGVPDAPRRDELVLVLVMCTGGRVHARVGGLELADVVGEDGLR